MLDSTDDAVALRAARDLLDRAGLAARHAVDLDVTGTVEVGLSISSLVDCLAEVKATTGPSTEEEIVTALAEAMGFEGSYESRRSQVHAAVFPAVGELMPGSASPPSWGRARPADPAVDDAEVVEDEAPPAPPVPIRRVPDTRPSATLVGPVSIARRS